MILLYKVHEYLGLSNTGDYFKGNYANEFV